MSGIDASHILVFVTSAAGGGAFVGKVVPWIVRLWQKREDRAAKLEEKRISANSHVKAAEIAAEAQRDVAEITGQHQVLSEANVFIRELRAEREEDRKRLQECEEKHKASNKRIDDLKKQIDMWETTESAREETFQNTMKRAVDCEREREKDRQRLTAFEKELRDLRRSLA